MKNYPASHGPARIEGVSVSAARPHLTQRSRAFWFCLGVFFAFTVAGFVAGIFGGHGP